MAENLRDVPAQYGTRPEGFYPRINSYGRRLLSVLPTLVFAVVLLVIVFERRAAAPLIILVVLLEALAALVVYSVLSPAIVAVTETHVLRGRLVGWKAAPLAKVEHSVFVERMQPRAALKAPDTAMARLRYRGIPGLWLLDGAGKRVMHFDGRIWDAKTLRAISQRTTPATTVYQQANVQDIDQRHPGMLTFRQKHPRFLSTVATVLAVVVLVALFLLHFHPEWVGGLSI